MSQTFDRRRFLQAAGAAGIGATDSTAAGRFGDVVAVCDVNGRCLESAGR